jgi:Glycosyl transferases group 1
MHGGGRGSWWALSEVRSELRGFWGRAGVVTAKAWHYCYAKEGDVLQAIFKKISRLRSDIAFRSFERTINSETIRSYGRIFKWAEDCVARTDELEEEHRYEECPDPAVRQGHRLAVRAREEFFGRYAHQDDLRLLLYVPSASKSPAGFSVMANLSQSLRHLGIQVRETDGTEPVGGLLDDFAPTFFLLPDFAPFLSLVDWDSVRKYRERGPLLVGLTASLEEYGNSPLQGRLEWARNHHVSFYFSFRPLEYLSTRPAYRPFFENGHRIASVEFGANVLRYYPVPGISHDLPFVFLGSGNPDKRPRYEQFFKDVFSRHHGFIAGPGWSHAPGFTFDNRRDRYLYARARVGINLHLEEQIAWPCELNERTYMLAACGVPQVMDNPALLPMRFSPGCAFVATSGKEYVDLFEHVLRNPEEGERAALAAQREVFARHTTFHRAEGFVLQLQSILAERG